jgi:hypothetical protein
MASKVYAGTSYKRYVDPNVSNLPDAKGLYAWSMLYANLCYLDGDTVESTGGLPDPTQVGLLLFLSDIPGIAQLKCYHTGATNAHQFTDITNEVSVPFLVTTSGGATVVTVDIGEVAQGYTGPGNAVRCTGFPAFGLADVVGAGATVDEIAVLVWANGGVMNAPVSENRDKGSKTVPQPMILLYSDYTETMRAGNNIFKDDSDYLWLIVGLHDVAQPEPPAIEG